MFNYPLVQLDYNDIFVFQISQVMITAKPFSTLGHLEIDGIDPLAAKFQNIYINMKKKQENYLDKEGNEFEVDVAEFMSQIYNLVVICALSVSDSN